MAINHNQFYLFPACKRSALHEHSFKDYDPHASSCSLALAVAAFAKHTFKMVRLP